MSLDQIAYTLLNTTASLARVYPSIFPKDSIFPAATYEVTTASSINALDGATGVYRSIVEVSLAAKTLSEVNSHQTSILDNVIGYTGEIGSSDVYNVELEDVNTDYDEDLEVYTKKLSLSILYKK